jgi:hypothetical protein
MGVAGYGCNGIEGYKGWQRYRGVAGVGYYPVTSLSRYPSIPLPPKL